MRPLRVRLSRSGAILADQASTAETWWERMVGLLNRSSLLPGEALLIPGCKGIHTIGMRFAIDAVYIKKDGAVVAIQENLQPGQVASPVAAAWAVLEMPAGESGRNGVRVGDRLEFENTLTASSAQG
jgi:uncharacterized protein